MKGGARAEPYLFEIKTDSSTNVKFIKKNYASGISGGCGIEAVLNIFNLDWNTSREKRALFDFSKQTKVCIDSKSSGDMWVDTIESEIESFTNILVASGIDLGLLSNNNVEVMTSSPVEFLADSISNNYPFIAQEMGGYHFVTYRSSGKGTYYKIDAYSNSVEEKDIDNLLMDLESDVSNGTITSIYKIVPK